MEPTRSITEPLAKVAPAILLAWATTVIGFGTLVTSSYAPLRSLGLVSAVSVTACLLTSLLVLPALLLSFGQPKTDVATHVDLPRSPQRSDAPMSVCVVIAAYNEAATVAKVVAGAKRYVPGVFVVDDGSTDTTAQQAEGVGAVVLRHPQNQGKGRAVCTGLARVLALDYTHVLLMDADLQHDPDDIPALLERAHLGVGDLVLGERPFSRETMPASRFYTNTISSRVISRFFIGTQVSDAQSGFRLIRTSLLKGIRLTGRGYEIETEMLIKLVRKGARIERTTVQLRYEEARSKLRPIRDTTRTCFLAVRYRFFPERWA
jgi:glycosyltransferase involved in cell wall biosynthesis